jgi:hypothetical protein
MLLCFIFSIISYVQFSSSDYVYVASIGKNWANGPISDAEASGYECSSGKVPAIDDFWFGTVTGCSCDSLIGDGLSRSACSRRSYLCSTVYQIGGIPYRLWRGTNICVKRGPNYLDLKTAKSAALCGSGYKSCGIADSLQQVLCYPNAVNCPYNFIKVLSANQQVPNDKNYTVIPLGFNGQDGKMIFSNENISGNTVNQFKIDDNQPCLSPDYKNLAIKPYYLEQSWGKNLCQNAIGGQNFDNAYTKVDSESYNKLYSDNQILGILLSLPKFQKYNYLSGSTSLFYKIYIGINSQCISKIADLVKIEDAISSVSTTALVGMIFGIFAIVILVIFSVIFCCNEGKEESLKVMNIIFGIFSSIPALIISAILVSKANNIGYDLSVFSDPNCTDSITSNAVASFSSKINSGVSMSVAYLLFSVLGFVSNLVALIV